MVCWLELNEVVPIICTIAPRGHLHIGPLGFAARYGLEVRWLAASLVDSAKSDSKGINTQEEQC
jgi:hypothetical protein